jgi:glycosyl hydrolase family 44
MRSINGLRTAMFVVLAALTACGGGGSGSSSSSSSSSGGTPPPPRTLFVATQPVGGVSTAALTTQPVVHVRTNGVTDTTDNSTVVMVAIVAGTGTAGAVLVGTATATAVAGVATFTNLGINSAGTAYQLGFAATNVTGTTSSTFTITAPPRSLFVATQPSGATPPAQFGTQPVIQVRSNGVLDSTDNTTVVTASILAGTGNAAATLLGTTTVTAVGGVATFTNLGIGMSGTGYQLRFTATGITEATSNPFAILVLGGVIPPSTPPASQVTFAIDSTQDVRAISRFIYGLNGWDPLVRPANLTLSRSGGNRMTAYNWETNASNAGADFLNQNDAFLGGGTTPNGAVGPGIVAARNAGAGIVVTMPTIGYVAADKNGGGDVAQTPNYLSVRFHQSPARKNAAFTLPPNTGDAFVYQDEYVHFLNTTFPGAFGHATTPIFLSLDNEPDLWQHTHARLRGDGNLNTQAGLNPTYAEIVQRSIDYAGAAKDVNPGATIFGPVNYGWQGMVRLQDAADHMNRDFLEFYLAQMAAAQTASGRRLLDVLDVHWYPEAQGNNAMGTPTRVTEENTDPGVVAARKQAPRSLWDPAYVETSWITGCCSGGAIRLIPRLKGKISANYPNTQLAITEYNYGAANHISGAIAQADVLGIFGREGLFAANLWRLASNNNFIYGAFESFRNYDGANGSFGNTSIRATNTDVVNASAYASVNAGDSGRMVVVAINKADSAQTAGIAVTHTTQFHTAQVYTLTSANSAPQRQADINITLTNAFQYSMPANSVTTLVLVP